MNNFKIGQKVVCIKDHSQGAVKRGFVYTILNFNTCGCGLTFDVGLTHNASICFDCGTFIGKVWWIHHSLFSILQNQYQFVSSEVVKNIEIIEEKSDCPIKELT